MTILMIDWLVTMATDSTVLLQSHSTLKLMNEAECYISSLISLSAFAVLTAE